MIDTSSITLCALSEHTVRFHSRLSILAVVGGSSPTDLCCCKTTPEPVPLVDEDCEMHLKAQKRLVSRS